MTDNIQKLYEIAGIKKQKSYLSCANCTKKTIKKLDEWGEEYIGCEHDGVFIYCPHAQEIYLPFTAEKQLELIKFVSNFKVYEMVRHKNRKWFMCASIGCDDYYESRSESFDQALANLIINLWQDLTDDQKQEIKRILE